MPHKPPHRKHSPETRAKISASKRAHDARVRRALELLGEVERQEALDDAALHADRVRRALALLDQVERQHERALEAQAVRS